jgi:two-component system KDP operon response regulator KdpE
MSSDRTGVLLVEDDQNIIDLVRSNLIARGHDVTVSKDGSDAVELLEAAEPEMVILDLMLPGGNDGFELCREMRERSSVGIVVLSARRAETDKVRALNLGADDYMTKPFGIDELLSRIHATLRRSRPASAEPAPGTLVVLDVEIVLEARKVTKGGQLVHLTPTELALLREFVLNPGVLLTHATLLRRVWGRGYETQTEYTRVYVARLRAKLEDSGGPPLFITEPRSGYRFTTDVAAR